MNAIGNTDIVLEEHQVDLIKYFNSEKVDGILVVHPTGSGKTITAIAISQVFLYKNPKCKTIVILPSGLISNFQKEMKKFGIENEDRYEIYSFQKFLNLNESCAKICKDNLLVIDEAHELRTLTMDKSKKTSRSKSVFECSTFAAKRLLLTATPFVNSKQNFFSIINILYGKDVVKKKNKLENIYNIRNFLKNRVSYLDKKEDRKNFPKEKYHKIEITMTDEYEENYCKIIKGDLVNDIMFTSPTVFYNAHRRAVNSSGSSEKYFSLKMDKTIELIRNYKSLIFSNWLEFGTKFICKKLKNLNIKYVEFTGKQSKAEKKKIVEDYNNGKYQVLIISNAGKLGLDLKEVRKVIVLDPVWNYAGMMQIVGRAARFKSHENLPIKEQTVDIYFLLLVTANPDCVSGDTILYNLIEKKRLAGIEINDMLQKISI